MLTVVGYANILDTVLLPQDPDYPRGLYTTDRTWYIQERWDTQLSHFGPLTTGRQWVLQGLTHTQTVSHHTHKHRVGAAFTDNEEHRRGHGQAYGMDVDVNDKKPPKPYSGKSHIVY